MKRWRTGAKRPRKISGSAKSTLIFVKPAVHAGGPIIGTIREVVRAAPVLPSPGPVRLGAVPVAPSGFCLGVLEPFKRSRQILRIQNVNQFRDRRFGVARSRLKVLADDLARLA